MSDDRDYIEAVLDGDLDAFDFLVQKYQKNIYYFVLRMLNHPENADEVTQKAFLKAYRGLSGFQFQSSFKTWLTAIALNLCRTERAKKKMDVGELPHSISDESFENRTEIEEKQHQQYFLKKALAELPERQKEVVCLRIYEELPFKDIADVLKSTESAVKVNFHHAMKSLKKWITERRLDVPD